MRGAANISFNEMAVRKIRKSIITENDNVRAFRFISSMHNERITTINPAMINNKSSIVSIVKFFAKIYKKAMLYVFFCVGSEKIMLLFLSHRFNVQPFRGLRCIALDVQVGEPYAVVMRHGAGGDLLSVHEELGGAL